MWSGSSRDSTKIVKNIYMTCQLMSKNRGRMRLVPLGLALSRDKNRLTPSAVYTSTITGLMMNLANMKSLENRPFLQKVREKLE